MKLVNNLEEQDILEKILEETKPPIPPECERLHWLLSSPFRYSASNPHSSRFRRSNAPEGVLYASASPEVAIAEMAFYRVLFFEEAPGLPLPTNPAEYSSFAVQIRTANGLDLTRPPINVHQALWTAPNDYSQCQLLAELARKEGVEAISYYSVRDLQHRLNYAVLHPAAFSQSDVIIKQTWRMEVRPDTVIAVCESPSMSLEFSRNDFDVASRLKAAKAA